MEQKINKKKCPPGYFTRKLAGIIARGPTIEDLESLALELVVTETHLKKLLKCTEEKETAEDIHATLREIEETKKIIYRLYRSSMLELGESRVGLWMWKRVLRK
ncbi:MAG: hypothetical protein ABWK01_09315 [Infirmifilum sp.]